MPTRVGQMGIHRRCVAHDTNTGIINDSHLSLDEFDHYGFTPFINNASVNPNDPIERRVHRSPHSHQFKRHCDIVRRGEVRQCPSTQVVIPRSNFDAAEERSAQSAFKPLRNQEKKMNIECHSVRTEQFLFYSMAKTRAQRCGL